jgi:hypothetical protein
MHYDQTLLSTWQNNVKALTRFSAFGFLPVPSFKTHPNPELIFLGRHLCAADAQPHS